MLDSPQEVLYWTLTPGQRLAIAEQLGVVRVRDWAKLPEERCRARLWLRRMRRRGSIAQAVTLAARLHFYALRKTEESLRVPGSHGWRAEIEAWRELRYRLLALAEGVISNSQ